MLSLRFFLPEPAFALRIQSPAQSGAEEDLARQLAEAELQNPEEIRRSLLALEDPQVRKIFTRILDRMLDTKVMEGHYGFGPTPDAFAFRDGQITRQELVEEIIEYLRNGSGWNLRDLVGGFWVEFNFPDPRDSEFHTVGPREMRDHSRPYDEHKEWWATLPLIWQLLPQNGVVLDVGAGKARLGEEILRYSDKNTLGIRKVISTDKHNWVAPGAVFDPRHEYQLQPGDVPELPAGTADLAILKWVLHHAPEDEQGRLINRLFSIVKPGGTVVVIEALVGSWSEIRPRLMEAINNRAVWPQGPWAREDLRLLKSYLQLEPAQQRHVLALEDFYGHLLVSHRVQLAQPAMYMDRAAVVGKFSNAGFVELPDWYLPYGLPPVIRYGPPSVMYVFQRPRDFPLAVVPGRKAAAGVEERLAVFLASAERLDGYRSALEEPKTVVIGRSLAEKFPGLQVLAALERHLVIARDPAETLLRLAEQGITHVQYFGGAEERDRFMPAARLMGISVTSHTPDESRFPILLAQILSGLGFPSEIVAAGIEEFAAGLEQLGTAA